MPSRARRATWRAAGLRAPALAAVTCLLAAALATACATPAVHRSGVWYTCCSASVTATNWHPGQQIRVAWTRTGTVPADLQFPAVTLSAVLTGPFSKADVLKAAISRGNQGSVTAHAAKITVSSDSPVSVVSVITIPASAPPGFYNLETVESSGGGTVSGESTVTVR